MLDAVKRLMPLPLRKVLAQFRNMVSDQYAVKCYSQEGEDMILRRIFEGQRHGFYVDVGAHHPRRFSNTFYFYKKGWSGINIEPNPDALQEFQSDRPRDKNIQLGVADTARMLKYYHFDEPALNTFDEDVVKSRLENTAYKVVNTENVPVERLDKILGTYLPKGKIIDFISIDVEGLDLAVLRSNDWQLFRPKYVLAEALNTTLAEVMKSDIVLFMLEQGYDLFSRTYNTLIFRDRTI